MGLVDIPKPSDELDIFKRRTSLAISRLATSKLGTDANPTFASLTVGALSGVIKATAGVLAGGAGHGDLAGVTANQHHNQSHVLTGTDHTVSGLTTGHVLQALSPTTFGFATVSGLPGTVTVVDDETERLALSPSIGDLCYQIDTELLYLYIGE